MRARRERFSKVWLVVVLVVAVISALLFHRFREARRDYVLLLDAKTGTTITELPLGWQLVGETPTQAIVERAGVTKLISLGVSKDNTYPSSEKAFVIGWSIFPATILSWLERPQEVTSSGRIAFLRVSGNDVFLVRPLVRNNACFSLTRLTGDSGTQVWRVESDFERTNQTPPVPTVPALGPSPSPGQRPTPTSPDGFPLAPTRVNVTIPPPISLAPSPDPLAPLPLPVPRSRSMLQAPDGSYPCPTLRRVSVSNSLVGIESDNRFMVFDRASGRFVGRAQDATDSPFPRLLGDLMVHYDFDALIADDPRSGSVVWKLPISSGFDLSSYQFQTSQTDNPRAYFLSPDQLTGIGLDGKVGWVAKPEKQNGADQSRFIGGRSRVNLTVTGAAIVALTTSGVNGFDPTTGNLLWKRNFGSRTLGLQTGNTNRVVALTTAHYVAD
jgi:PQQ-like domain